MVTVQEAERKILERITSNLSEKKDRQVKEIFQKGIKDLKENKDDSQVIINKLLNNYYKLKEEGKTSNNMDNGNEILELTRLSRNYGYRGMYR